MKRTFTLLLLFLCANLLNANAQEVRGIETRRVIYEVPQTNGEVYRYYGWELINRNSIAVSIDISLWCHDFVNKIVKTQSCVLKPGEKYIFKREEHPSTDVDHQYRSNNPISSYYIEYKAFKLH